MPDDEQRAAGRHRVREAAQQRRAFRGWMMYWLETRS